MASLHGFGLEAYCVFAIYAVNVFLLAIYVAAMAWSFVPTFSCDKLRLAAAALLEELVARLRRTEETDFERKLRQLAEAKRVEASKWLCAYLLHVFAGLAAILMVTRCRFFIAEGSKFEDRAFARAQLHYQNAPVTLLLCFGVTLYMHSFGSRAGPRTLDVCHTLIFAPLIGEISASRHVHMLMSGMVLTTLSRLFLAGCIGSPPCTACLNAIHVIITCMKYLAFLGEMSDAEAELVHASYGKPTRVILFYNVAVGLITWILSILVKGCFINFERSKFQLRAALMREATTKSLQAVVCDAVVNVTEALVLNEPSTHLGHFLVRPPPRGSYEGTSLLDFVQEEDRERVGQQVTSSSVGPGTTLSISTKLIDGNTAPVNVQMYCVSFTDCDDRRGFCIGILEIKSQSGSVDRVDNCVAEAPDGGTPAPLDPDVIRSVSEAADGSIASALSAVVPLVMNAGHLEAAVDLRNPKLPILSTSPSMTMLVGPLEVGSSSLLDWFGSEEGAFVVNLIADALQRYARRREASLAVTNIGRVRLQPRHTIRAGLQYVADVTVDMTDSHSDNMDTKTPVVLRFSNIGMQKASRRTRMRVNSLRAERQRPRPGSALSALDGNEALSL
eukprot:TRINITY_DN13904_c0_g3_i1.p1 TRINITY_DN13904_c0_g3~~TRINITY_DN13904_c0_g3_i1.p1  ORF type:complete len:616 (+),score=72.98 TRINITY_DN13904_c0_g3_i1:50-1897(+)